MKQTNANIMDDLRKLADGWCARRSLVPLRHFLPGYFALNGMTDGVGELEIALKDVLAFAKNELTEAEKMEVKRVLRLVQEVLYRR